MLYPLCEYQQFDATCQYINCPLDQSKRALEVWGNTSSVDCLVIELGQSAVVYTLSPAFEGMLHRACQQHCCPREIASEHTKLCWKLLGIRFPRSEILASLHSGSCFSSRNFMETFRQRRTSHRLAARPHTTQSHKDVSEPANTMQQAPAQPATKKRKTTAVKPVRKGLKEQLDAPKSLAEEANSSVATVFDATPAIPSAPPGIPLSVPAHVPADPNVLHCWTKDSMAQAAACLAERDPGQ